MILWFEHPKYTREYLAGQAAELRAGVRRTTRHMRCVATAAVMALAAVQLGCMLELLPV